MSIPDPNPVQRGEARANLLLIWAVSATIVSIASIGLAIVLFLQARTSIVPQTANAAASPFLALPESALVGPYKWISKSGSESFIHLHADHTFSKDGTTNVMHRWELTRDALVVNWLRSQNRLKTIERPGVYVEIKDGVETARMEKQE